MPTTEPARPRPAAAAPTATAPTGSAVRRVLRRARDGVTLDVAEAEVALHARGADLTDLCASAARVRDAGLLTVGRPGVVTYSRKVFIPLTRLCRDRCHYCTFVTVPHRAETLYLEREEVLAIARAGAAAGCKEALFTLGDRPEERWPEAARWLEERGYASTLEYLRACAIAVLEETGLLPHLNPGVLTWQELMRLKPVAPSMGMMLETTATRLWSTPGQAHFASPDKEPRVRLKVLDDAGATAVPFTTGLLIGIGETLAERAETIFALREVSRTYGGVQEVIVQNFRAKPDTAMRSHDDAEIDDLLATIAVTRLVLGPGARIQAPPNLVGEQHAAVLGAGIDDWGGVSPVTPDHVNPEAPWPAVEELARRSAGAGFTLRERLTVYPQYQREPWLDPRLRAHVTALAGPDGLVREGALPVGLAWQEPEFGVSATGRTGLHAEVDTTGRTEDRRSDFDTVYGDWGVVADRAARTGVAGAGALPREVVGALRRAEADPAGLGDEDALALLDATGSALEALCALADDVRRDAVGEEVTYVVNRNINFTNICYTGCRFCAFAQRRTDADAFTLSLRQIGDRAQEAWEAGATEVCLQGGIDPDLPGTAYFDIAAAVRERVPDLHVHAFSPMEVVNGATRTGLSVREWLIAAKEAGLGSIPGTAAEILDDDVRWVLTKGKLSAAAWIEVVTTAHELGLRSSATMMYGHVDAPHHWVAHLRTLAGIQDRTGGFTEFVPLPFVHANAPLYLAGVARPGPTVAQNRSVHALARLMLHGRIDNIQCSWVKLGDVGVQQLLTGGANDMGGTLMEETISRMAGSEHGSERTVPQLQAIATGIGRPTRQRTTTYGEVDTASPSTRRPRLPLLDVSAP